MKGPYNIMNSKGQICGCRYDIFDTNEEGRQYTLKTVETFQKMLNKARNKNII